MAILNYTENSKSINLYFSTMVYSAIILSIFIAPYFVGFWWKYIPSTILMVIVTKKLINDRYFSYLGLKIPTSNLVIFLLMFTSFAGLSNYFIKYQAHMQNLSITPIGHYYLWYVGICFQALNEEIVFRSLALKFFMRTQKYKVIISILVALIFSLAHFCFYHFAQKIYLNLFSVINLFLFGLTCNLLFLLFRHIWFGYALHASWNLTRYTHTFLNHGTSVSEGELFNILESSVYITIILLILIVTLCLVLWKNPQKHPI